MGFSALEKAFISACKKIPLNYDEINGLIEQGVNVNETDEYGDSVAEDIFHFYPDVPNDGAGVSPIEEVADILIKAGLDTEKYALRCIEALIFSSDAKHSFYAMRRILSSKCPSNQEAYEEALEGTGTEESFQRCCEHNHEYENIYYAMCEMIWAKQQGLEHEKTDLYYSAIGMCVEKIVYFKDTVDTATEGEKTAFYADIGFVSGDRVLVLCHSINILFSDYRTNEQPQVDANDIFGATIVGKTIVDIYFDHKDIKKGKTNYGQPTINIKFDDGTIIKFTHNFGEVDDKLVTHTFEVE